MKIEDVHTVNELAEYIVDSHYRDEEWGNYRELMNKVDTKISELWANENNDDSDDWMIFGGDYITLYRVLPTNSNGIQIESIENYIGMSFVSRAEDLYKVPWYDEENSSVVKVTVPTKDKTFIAFRNFLDGIIEVLLPNVCAKYNVETIK